MASAPATKPALNPSTRQTPAAPALSQESREQAIARLNAQGQMLQRQGQELEAQSEAVERALVEAQRTHDTITALDTKEPDHPEFLTSIGSRVMTPVKLAKKEFIVQVGAGVAVTLPPLEAKKALEKRVEDLQKAKSTLDSRLEQVSAQLQALSQAINARANQ